MRLPPPPSGSETSPGRAFIVVSDRGAIDRPRDPPTISRTRFWWLGPGKGSYIVSLDGDAVTVKVVQSSWNRRTQPYEEAVARDFAALGLRA